MLLCTWTSWHANTGLIALSSLCQVGKLGYTELSALTLGNTFYNLTGLSMQVP